MQKYKCHKIVKAMQIQRMEAQSEDDGFVLLGDGEEHFVTDSWFKKFSPQIGGYLVEYQDGYQSFSPKEAFEEGYTPFKEKGLTFGEAFDHIRNLSGQGMRLPHWGSDVVIRVQAPDVQSKMTAPYLYVESRFGRVPWKETMVELFAKDWIIVS